MAKIKRYNCGYGDGMFEERNGDYVEWSDYQKLNRELKRLLQQTDVSGRSEQLRGEMLEQKAKEALQEIRKHTTLCCDDDEEHIFICGYNAGYNDQKSY